MHISQLCDCAPVFNKPLTLTRLFTVIIALYKMHLKYMFKLISLKALEWRLRKLQRRRGKEITMLDAKTIATVKSTVPLLAATGPNLPPIFMTACLRTILS